MVIVLAGGAVFCPGTSCREKSLPASLQLVLRVFRVYKGAAEDFDAEGVRHFKIPEDLQDRFNGIYCYYVSPKGTS